MFPGLGHLPGEHHHRLRLAEHGAGRHSSHQRFTQRLALRVVVPVHANALRPSSPLMQTSRTHQVGKYLVTPMTKLNEAGQYAASVSIRRGMHDRVFRLIPHFDCAASAGRYALAQGRLFILNNQLA